MELLHNCVEAADRQVARHQSPAGDVVERGVEYRSAVLHLVPVLAPLAGKDVREGVSVVPPVVKAVLFNRFDRHRVGARGDLEVVDVGASRRVALDDPLAVDPVVDLLRLFLRREAGRHRHEVHERDAEVQNVAFYVDGRDVPALRIVPEIGVKLGFDLFGQRRVALRLRSVPDEGLDVAHRQNCLVEQYVFVRGVVAEEVEAVPVVRGHAADRAVVARVVNGHQAGLAVQVHEHVLHRLAELVEHDLALRVLALQEAFGVVAGEEVVARGDNERRVVGVVVLRVEMLRGRGSRPDEAVVIRVALVLALVDNVLAFFFVVVPAVAAVHRLFKGIHVDLERLVVAGPVQLQAVPLGPFDRGGHCRAGAEFGRILASVAHRVVHARLRFRGPEDCPHVAEVGVVVAVVGGEEERSLRAIRAHLLDAERVVVRRVGGVGEALHADSVGRDAVKGQGKGGAHRVREVHHAGIVSLRVGQHVIVVRKHVPDPSAVGGVLHGNVRREHRRVGREFNFQCVEGVITVKQVSYKLLYTFGIFRGCGS